MILKMVHFCMWGHLYICKNVNLEGTCVSNLAKQSADVDERVPV